MVGCALCVPKEAKIKEEGPPLTSNCISSSRPPTLPIYDLNKERLAFSMACKFLPHLIHRTRHYKVLCFHRLLTDCKIWGNRRLVSLSLYAESIGSEMKLAFAISQGRFRMNGPHRRVILCKPMGARSIKALSVHTFAYRPLIIAPFDRSHAAGASSIFGLIIRPITACFLLRNLMNAGAVCTQRVAQFAPVLAARPMQQAPPDVSPRALLEACRAM